MTLRRYFRRTASMPTNNDERPADRDKGVAHWLALIAVAWLAAIGCGSEPKPANPAPAAAAPANPPPASPAPAAAPASASASGGGGQFEKDVAFLREHGSIVLLSDGSGAQVVVAPGYQGRVMTSTTGGADAPSFGWIGRAAIESGKRQPHMNVFGGEDRFWLGPEGGQYALYFKAGDPFDLDHWQVPEPIDWGAWDVQSQSATAVRVRKRMTIVNYAGTTLDIAVDRTIRLLTASDVSTLLGAAPASTVRVVAYE